jgi:hypothetical protein
MDRTISQIVKDTPNDMELGKKIRELYWLQQEEEKLDETYLEHWTCDHCGKHTHEVDYDYLANGTNHLECELRLEASQ